MTRLAVFFEAPRQVAVREEPVPPPAIGEVQVQTSLSAVSPGTEMLIYRGEAPPGLQVDETLSALAGDFAYPLKYGYAVVGRVIETGPEVDPSWSGREVFAFRPHESCFVCRPEELIPLPDGIPAEDAAFLPNMETAVNFLMDARPVIGEHVAVFGQGIVGLLTTALLADFPLASLVTVDSYPQRRTASLELGATASFAPGAALPGDGVDLAFELSGSPLALDPAIAACGFGARVVIGSWYGSKRVSLDLGGRFHRDRIRLISSQVSTLAPEWSGRWSKARRLEVAWEMIRRVQPSRLVTHRLPLAEAAKAYELLDRQPEDAVQVILEHQSANA
jgi:2-desacetyl-2-hydroxyethyl bacteriochlorophyllide A dehydrogenase